MFTAATAPTVMPLPRVPTSTDSWPKSPAAPPAIAAARAARCISSRASAASSPPRAWSEGRFRWPSAPASAAKERNQRQVAAVFFGDGAGQAGPFHESLNIASLWRLPLIFICENNGYAEFTPLAAHTKIERLARHAETYGIPASTVDGNDLFAVQSAIGRAVGRCRAGRGPIFVECLTRRMRGHYEGDPAEVPRACPTRRMETKGPDRPRQRRWCP
jgi:hypothetical protein